MAWLLSRWVGGALWPCAARAGRSFSLGKCPGKGEQRQKTTVVGRLLIALSFPPPGVPETAPVRTTLPPPKVVDRWNEKRSMFGVYDNIGILGNFERHPKDLIKGPIWLRGWKGNELQRCIRKKKMVGDRMFLQDLHNLNKRIKYLYKQFNRKGKHR
uniref:Large ribosomal subunit protein mL51 n=1 Tax=Vombatus ursinus TaxID=29139 RepID=A0A4X2LG68_VOMUR